MNTITINAIYQNGIIKPLEPVNLAENEQVVLQVIDHRQSRWLEM
jgi:predicted DNA-binding antitoxin AbrB/MazE fold protein